MTSRLPLPLNSDQTGEEQDEGSSVDRTGH